MSDARRRRSPGAAIAWPVTEITLTGATLGLTSQYQADGSVLLLPAYTMTDDSGSDAGPSSR